MSHENQQETLFGQFEDRDLTPEEVGACEARAEAVRPRLDAVVASIRSLGREVSDGLHEEAEALVKGRLAYVCRDNHVHWVEGEVAELSPEASEAARELLGLQEAVRFAAFAYDSLVREARAKMPELHARLVAEHPRYDSWGHTHVSLLPEGVEPAGGMPRAVGASLEA